MKQRYGSCQLGELVDWLVHTAPEAAAVVVTNKQGAGSDLAVLDALRLYR